MALHTGSLYCADVPLRNCSLTHTESDDTIGDFRIICKFAHACRATSQFPAIHNSQATLLAGWFCSC